MLKEVVLYIPRPPRRVRMLTSIHSTGDKRIHDMAGLTRIFNYKIFTHARFRLEHSNSPHENIWPCLSVSISFTSRQTIFEFGANVPGTYIDMPGHSKITSTQFNSTLPFSEPLQRNRILLLGCWPLLSLAQQTQHDPQINSKHCYQHVSTDNVSWLNPAVHQVLSRYWVFRSKSRGLHVAVSLVENDVMPTLPLQQLGETYMVKWVKSRRRKKWKETVSYTSLLHIIQATLYAVDLNMSMKKYFSIGIC